MKYKAKFFLSLPILLKRMYLLALDLLLFFFIKSGGSITMNGVKIAINRTGAAIPANYILKSYGLKIIRSSVKP